MEWQNLWAPWRSPYVKSIPPEGASKCFLCDIWAATDEDDHLVLHRGTSGMILLNRFPYTSGHLMVCPAAHLADLTDLSVLQRGELIELIAAAERIIQIALNPQGINIGMNIGRCAGAGLPGHLHVHLVPRWGGDTNFMHTVGNIRVIPQALEQIYAELKTAAAKVV